ncbi:MAG: nuclear transport factor 2 family protein [Actinomycetota bacterium]|nr:nuclear transport factor 2 family protein [Actinomycetota bacterium]
MSRENVELMRSSLDGWNRGDIGAWLAPCHPDIEFRTSGVYPGLDPIYRGHAELRHFWEVMREPWESLQIRIEQVREVDDQLVSLCVFEGHAREGMTVRREVAWISRFADELIVRADAYGSWDEAVEAVGLPE